MSLQEAAPDQEDQVQVRLPVFDVCLMSAAPNAKNVKTDGAICPMYGGAICPRIYPGLVAATGSYTVE